MAFAIDMLRMRPQEAGGAISFVGSGEHSSTTLATTTFSFSSLLDELGGTPTLQDGDLILVALAHTTLGFDKTQAELTVAGNVSAAGYTPAHTDLYADDNSDTNLQVQYRFYNSADGDTGITIPAAQPGPTSVVATIHVFRGVHQTTPLDVTPVTQTRINGGVPDALAITPVTAGAWIVVVGAASANAALTNPANLSTVTNHFRSAEAAGSPGGVVAAGLKTDWASGAFDPETFGGGSSSTTISRAMVSLALRPA